MKLFFFSLLVWACVSPGWALSLSFDEIAARVRKHHPALQAARLAVDEARGRCLGAGRLTNPALSYDFQNQSRVTPQTGIIALEQAFPLTRRLALEKQLSAQQVAAAELEVRNVERRLVAEARGYAVRFLALTMQRQLREEQMTLAIKLAEFSKQRAEAGETSPLEAGQFQLDARKLGIEARLLETEGISWMGILKPMLGIKADEPFTLSGGLPEMKLPPMASWQKRPDFLMSVIQTEAAQTEERLALAKRVPDVTAGIFGAHEMQDVTSAQRERTGFLGFRVSIPLPFWNRNQGEIAQKAAAAERARLDQVALASLIESEADTARREMEAQAALARETRDVLVPLATRHAEACEKAYASGQTDLVSLLRARDQRLQFEAAALDAVRDFHLARIRYEAATTHGAP